MKRPSILVESATHRAQLEDPVNVIRREPALSKLDLAD